MHAPCFVCNKLHDTSKTAGKGKPWCIYRKRLICVVCLDEEFPRKSAGGGSPTEPQPGRSDREYHGGQFNRGEW